jgi:hypothetical protein
MFMTTGHYDIPRKGEKEKGSFFRTVVSSNSSQMSKVPLGCSTIGSATACKKIKETGGLSDFAMFVPSRLGVLVNLHCRFQNGLKWPPWLQTHLTSPGRNSALPKSPLKRKLTE